MVSEKAALGGAIFIAGLCSIVYELLISTTASYFLGDSITQFSLIIGIYMAAMGLGSYFSKWLGDAHLPAWFIGVETLLGLLGGCSVPLLYFSFPQLSAEGFQALTLGVTLGVGVLTGFEIPLLARIMKKYYPLRTNLANVMALDYFGALAATLLFPFLLLPFFGLFRSAVAFGLLNIVLGIGVLYYFVGHLSKRFARRLAALAFGVGLCFTALLWQSGHLLERWDSRAYPHRIIYSEQTPYQNLALTLNRDDLRLYINRIIQFSSTDEYRYHEALGVLPVSVAPYAENVLILGGGEGLLAREVLKSKRVKQLTIVDLDTAVFKLARQNSRLKALNEGALFDPRVKTVAQDASRFLGAAKSYYDLILVDLPDPSNEAVARLYSTWFFDLARQRLTPNGLLATQATSPFHTRKAFWCIVETLKASGFGEVQPYHTYVPSFGDWGFVLAGRKLPDLLPFSTPLPVRYLSEEVVAAMMHFPKDTAPLPGLQPNRLDQPALLAYYLEEWEKWSREQLEGQ